MAKRALQHDPEYEAIPAELQEKRIKLIEDNVREQSKKKIESIIKSNFLLEVSSKSSEIDSLEEALQECRATCDRLRACAVTKYYANVSQDPQTSSGIPSVHPTVKKYLGKHPSGVENDTQYSSSSNSTGELLERISGIPSSSVKQEPQYLSPSKDISTRAPRFKTKCKIIVGNVSRFIPSWQRDVSDQSQYKWMVYVRGDKKCPNIETFVSKVTFLLHQSYRPNDVVEIFNPPFHLVKRGWGEFLMRVQLHFHDTRNKSVDILHFLKLDKTCTGLQTLGAETVVDLQLFKPEAIINSLLCAPTTSRPSEEEESFAELQSSEPTNVLLNSSEVCSPVRMEIDSDSRASASVPISISVPNNNNTQDILTTDALTTTTEQVVNSKPSVNNAVVKPVPSGATTVNNLAKAPVPNGVNKAYLKCTDSEGRVLLVPQSSLLRFKSQALVKKTLPADANKTKETKTAAVPSYILKVVPNQESGKNQVLLIPMSDKKVQSAVGTPLKCVLKPNNVATVNSQIEKSLCSWEEDLSNIKIDYYKSFVELLKRVCRAFPLVKKDVDNNTHPYCASSLEEFLRWNIGKQRASEWKRAGVMRTAILNLLKKHKLKYLSEDRVWSRGALMTWCRKNGYVPMNSEKMTQLPEPKWSGVELCSITNADDIVSTLQKENSSRTDSFTDEIDILSVSDDKPVVPKLNQNQQVNLTLPPSDEACTYIKEIASLVGVNIKPLEVEPSTSAPLVEEVILAACRQLATDLIRSSVNEGYKRMGGQLCPEEITVSDVYSAIKEVPQFDFLTNSHLGIPKESRGET